MVKLSSTDLEELKKQFQESMESAATRYRQGQYSTCSLHLKHASELAAVMNEAVSCMLKQKSVEEELGL